MKTIMDQQFWMNHVAELEREATSASAYARREGISVAAIYYWQRKSKKLAAGPSKPCSSFVQVRVAEGESAPHTPCVLILPSAIRLEIAALPSPEWLVSLLHAMSGVR